jgi:hypothetical protein
LGPILWDFDKLSMSFWRVDRQVHWRGLDASAGAHIRALDNAALFQLIAEFAAIFATPRGLPPPRRADHQSIYCRERH